MNRLALALALSLMPAVTLGSTIIGNPNSRVVLVDGDNVYVHSVVAYKCTTGSQTIPVDATLDLDDEATLTFNAATYCDVVVRVRWTPEDPIVPVAVTGFDNLVVSSSGAAFEIELDATYETASLTQ